MYQVETLDARVLTIADARAIAELIVKVWPKSGKSVEFREQQMLDLGRNFHGPDAQAPRSMVIRESGRIIAHAAFVPRTIGTTSGDLTIAGLARVCSDPDFRGQGLGELVVREIFALIDKQVFPFSLFQTSTVVRPFYEKLGACPVTNYIVNSLGDDPRASPFWDEVILRYPKDRQWPEGEIDLRGPGY
ncbi:MAG: GNAT family N-acetyltransferase [Bythopirellula sp.]|nr:GNAT family N-acetyltransferase [Bythopirellula sp.]